MNSTTSFDKILRGEKNDMQEILSEEPQREKNSKEKYGKLLLKHLTIMMPKRVLKKTRNGEKM